MNLSFLGAGSLQVGGTNGLLLATAATFRRGVKRFTTWAPLLIPFYRVVRAGLQRLRSDSRIVGTGPFTNCGRCPCAQLAWLAVVRIAGTSLESFALRKAAAATSGNAARSAEHTLSMPLCVSDGQGQRRARSTLTLQGYADYAAAYEGIDPAGLRGPSGGIAGCGRSNFTGRHAALRFGRAHRDPRRRKPAAWPWSIRKSFL